jgi:hypothetical protein
LEQKWGDTFSDLSILISLLVTNHCRAAIRQDAGVMTGSPAWTDTSAATSRIQP